MKSIKDYSLLKKIKFFLITPINFILSLITKPVRNIFRKLALGFAMAFIISNIITFFIRFDVMPSNTMLETFKKGELIITSKLRYAITINPFVSKLTEKTFVFSRPKRGDIVLVKDPKIRNRGFFSNLLAYPIYFLTLGKINNIEENYIVKRTIGLPNEAVEIIDKTVYIDGKPLNEPWFKVHLDTRILNEESSDRDNFESYIVGYNEYFLLSDNRDYGYDSRDFGGVTFGLIKGKVITK